MRVPLRHFTDRGFDPDLIQRGTVLGSSLARDFHVGQFPLIGSYAVGAVVPRGDNAQHANTVRQLKDQARKAMGVTPEDNLTLINSDREILKKAATLSGIAIAESQKWATLSVGRGPAGTTSDAAVDSVVATSASGGQPAVPRWLAPVSDEERELQKKASRNAAIDDFDVVLWPSCLVSSKDFAPTWRALSVQDELPKGLQRAV